MDEDEFIARDYQSELADIATKQNSILYLPTGSGKTYISILVIKKFLGEIERSLEEGGKIIAIIVNKVPLVEQTARVLSRHLPVLHVGYYCGAMGLDDLTKEEWAYEFQLYRVVVMTVQILVDILRLNKLRVDQLAVLVLDECHHASGKDAMAQLMELVRRSPASSQPRILGMSASLLNNEVNLLEVDSTIAKLEATLNAKVVTSYKRDVVRFSTKAEVIYEFFDCQHATSAEQEALRCVSQICFQGKYDVKKVSQLIKNELFFHPLFSATKSVKFPTLKKDIEKCIDDIGVYGGSKVVLNIICLLERTILLSDNQVTIFALRRLICDLTALRENLSMKIFKKTGNVVLENSSRKLQTLVEVLKRFSVVPEKTSEKDKKKFCAIVFVKERLTAKILWAVLEDLSKQEEYKFLRPEFVVGTRADPRDDIRSTLLAMEWNSAVLTRFRDGSVNVLISSSVLEEGIDIPDCNVVVAYDSLSSYRQYIQAQGRARHETSAFVVMIPLGPEGMHLRKKIEEWESLRNRVNQYVKRTAGGPVPLCLNDKEDTCAPYSTPSGALLEVISAISVLNRYCMDLSQRGYYTVTPLCNSHSDKDGFTFVLKMPIPCPYRELVEGPTGRTMRGARRLAVFELCKRLHQVDELSDSLKPKKGSKLLESKKLFPFWDPKFLEESVSKHAMYLEKTPDCLNGGLKEGQDVYLHVLKVQPSSARPQSGDSRKTVYYDMFASVYDFAIISPNKMPKVCDFPLFVSGIDLKVHVVPSEEKISLNPEELKALFAFHANLFLGPVPVVQPHTTLDPSMEENAFLLAPVRTDGDGVEIQWDMVKTYTDFQEVRYIHDTQRRAMKINSKELEHCVIQPWYRSLLRYEAYLVTEVCEDMDADSAFPTIEFDTFADYFAQKYNLILYHHQAPLLEVRHLFTKIIALTPSIETKKRRWDKDNEEVREHMVPELCGRLNFPSLIWLKATLLPSALHRLQRLLICEELRQRIAKEALTISACENEELVADPTILQVKDKKEYVSISTKHGLGKGSIKLNEVRQSVLSRKPWGNEQEPVDVSRSLESLNIMEMAFYEHFISKNNGLIENPKQKKTRKEFTLPDVTPGEGAIRMLAEEKKDVGPQMREIFQATTSKSSNEVQHQETLTNLGRTVLNLGASLYLFFSHPLLRADKLEWLVSKLILDHNVAQCGFEKNLQAVIKVQQFACDTWNPPFFQVPKIVAEPVIQSKSPSSILNSIYFSLDEQRSGILGPETQRNLAELLVEGGEANFGEYAHRLLGHQSISVEDMAAAVYALIGLYFKTNGLDGAVRLMSWFRLLPSDSIYLILEKIRRNDHQKPTLVDNYLQGVGHLEKKIQYKFRNRTYLLDAFTHNSFIDAGNEGQDRLSAVGYSILDFLIAIYVWESFSNRSAEDREQLRAALSNRLTHAALLVRYDLHKHILSSSTRLMDVIDTFVRYQDEREHVIDQETFLRIFDYEVDVDEKAEVPAALAYTFSALVGAVYLDTYCDLRKTWEFVYRFLKNEIELFSKKIPPQPKAFLDELTPKPSFSKFETVWDLTTDRYVTVCQIHTNGYRKDVQACGRSAAESENTAAKKAVNMLIFSLEDSY